MDRMTFRIMVGLVVFFHLTTLDPVFLFQSSSVRTNVLVANPMYFPSKLDAPLRVKIQECEKKALSPFEFVLEDFEDNRLAETFKKMSDRAHLEGRVRGESLRCLREKATETSELSALDSGLESLFVVERQLFFTYVRWLDAQLGWDRGHRADSKVFLSNRYDLMKLIQMKSRDILRTHPPEKIQWLLVEQEFASLYLSVLRGYYDFFYAMNEDTRIRYFHNKQTRNP